MTILPPTLQPPCPPPPSPCNHPAPHPPHPATTLQPPCPPPPSPYNHPAPTPTHPSCSNFYPKRATTASIFSSVDTDAPGFTFSTDLPTVPSSRQEGYKGQETGEGVGNADLMSALNQSSVSISRRRENGFRVQCEDGEVCWRPMVTTHWPRLLSHAGVNMDGR